MDVFRLKMKRNIMKRLSKIITVLFILFIFLLFPNSISLASIFESDDPPDLDSLFESEILLKPNDLSESFNTIDRRGVIYLTFDDGPSNNVTPVILDILKQEGALATFYVLPIKNVDDIFWRIINEGHQLGNHTSTHNYHLVYRSGLDVFKKEVINNHEFILNNFGYIMKTFRFPGAGSLAKPADWINMRKDFLHYEMDYRDFSWHISGDESAGHVLREVKRLESTHEHIIILFHDSAGRRSTPGIIKEIVPVLKERGYTFDVVYNFPLSPAEEARIKEQKRIARENEILQAQLDMMEFESLR